MTRQPDAPWVMAVMANVAPEERRPHLHCERCGERLVTELPMRAGTYVEVSNGFLRAHADCQPPRAVTP